MNKKEQIMNVNQIRFLENAKKYAKKMKLKIEESEIDLEKAKAITNQWYDKFFNKTKEINIDAIIKKNKEQARKKAAKCSLAELKYSRPGSLKI